MVALPRTEHIGRLGAWRTIRTLPPGLDSPVTRASSTRTTLAGTVLVQRAPRSSRQWSLSLPLATPDDVAALVELESMPSAAPMYWYDLAAAVTNMLHPSVAAPGLWGDEPYSTVSGTLTYSVAPDGASVVDVSSGGEAVSSTVPIIEGRTYTLSATASASSRVRLHWVDADEAAVSSTDGASGTGRRSVTAAAPVGAAGVQIGLDPDTTADFRQIQLTETNAPITWYPGEGIPRVTVAGLERTYQQIRSDGTVRRDYQATLVEVG